MKRFDGMVKCMLVGALMGAVTGSVEGLLVGALVSLVGRTAAQMV